MNEIELILAKAGDENIIHQLKYEAFLPLYNRYQDDETSPATEPIEKVTKQLKSENTDYYIIKYNSKHIGAIRIHHFGYENGKKIYRIAPIFIIPKFQNLGIGYKVLNMIFDMYKDADVWWLDTIKEEPANCHLYEKCGFNLVGNEKKINDKMTIIFYEKVV